MTVLVLITKSDSFSNKGDIRTFKNVEKIIKKADVFELITAMGYCGTFSVENARIISVEW